MVESAGSGGLIGRRQELAMVRRAITDVRTGTARTILVGGEAGIGKTRLLREVAAIARAESLGVHRGTCPPSIGGIPVPFAPFSSVLRSVVRSVDARLVDHLTGAGRQELALLLPELGAADPGLTAETGSARLFEAVLLLLDRAARRGPGMVLLLDDLHWADASARALLAWLVTELRDTRILVVVAYRSGPGTDDPLTPLLVELARSDTVDWIELAPLAPADALQLLEQATPSMLEHGRGQEIVRRSGGIPLYLEELARGGQDGPPASVRMAVARAVGSLDAGTRHLVELLAAAGGPVRARLLADVMGLPAAQLDGPISVAADAGLLAVHAQGVSRPEEVAIRHDLVAEAVLGLAGPASTAALHRSWADALERPAGETAGAPMERAAMIARHRLEAGERAGAVPALAASAEAALAARAFSAAHAAFDRALALAGADLARLVPDPVAFLDAAATAAWLAGHPGTALERSEAATAASGPDPDPAVLAARRVREARFRLAAGDPAGAVGALEVALAALPDGEARWRTSIDLGRALVAAGRPEEAIVPCEAAGAAARRAGLSRLVARAAAATALALSAVGDHAGAAAVLDGVRHDPDLALDDPVQRSRVSRLPDAVLRALDEATVRLREQDPAASLAVAERGRMAATARGLDRTLGSVLVAVAAWDLVRLGRWREAREVLETGRPEGDAGPTGAWRSVAGWLAVTQGRLDEADPLLRGLDPRELTGTAGPDWPVIAAAAVATAAWSRGALLDARASCAAALRWTARDPAALTELILLALAVEADAVQAAAARGDPGAIADARATAAELEVHARLALERADRGPSDPASARGRWRDVVAARLDGELLRIRGERATAAWGSAVLAADRAGDRWSGAIARLRAAEGLLLEPGRSRADADADRVRAVKLLREAFEVADDLGAAPLAGAVDHLARRARVSLQPAVAADGPRAAALALGLSERETDVLALLAQGRSDREIAQELFITEKTVGHHVSHILGKLDVPRRGQAAAVAHRIGLAGSPQER